MSSTFSRNTLSLAQAAQAGTPDLTDSAEASLHDLLHPSPNLTPGERQNGWSKPSAGSPRRWPRLATR